MTLIRSTLVRSGSWAVSHAPAVITGVSWMMLGAGALAATVAESRPWVVGQQTVPYFNRAQAITEQPS